MPDIAKCSNENCPLKEKCYRFTSKPSEFSQAYADFTYDEGCEYFWDTSEK